MRRAALCLMMAAMLAGGCEPQTDDRDGDGYQAHEDCHDANIDIHPDAAEICEDQLDNDCDLQVDAADADCVP